MRQIKILVVVGVVMVSLHIVSSIAIAQVAVGLPWVVTHKPPITSGDVLDCFTDTVSTGNPLLLIGRARTEEDEPPLGVISVCLAQARAAVGVTVGPQPTEVILSCQLTGAQSITDTPAEAAGGLSATLGPIFVACVPRPVNFTTVGSRIVNELMTRQACLKPGTYTATADFSVSSQITPGIGNDTADSNFATGNPVVKVEIREGARGCTPTSPVPTLTEWGLIALAVLLAGSLAFMIRRRFTPRPAGA
jgi:hypothetical protein